MWQHASMALGGTIWFSVVLRAFCATLVADGMVVKFDEEVPPRAWTPLLAPFWLGPNATLHLELKAVVTARPIIDLHLGRTGCDAVVVLFSEKQLDLSAPLLMNPSLTFSTYLPTAWRGSLATSNISGSFQSYSFDMTRYVLGVLQPAPPVFLRITGQVSFVDSVGSHLEVRMRYIPALLEILGSSFLASALVFIALVAYRCRLRSRLHALILAVLLVKSGELLLLRLDLLTLARSGSQTIGQHLLCQVLRQVESVLEMVVFCTIGLGWKVVRSHLRSSEWAFLVGVGSASFILGVLGILCNLFDKCRPHTFKIVQFTLHYSCYLLVAVAISFNIFTLQTQISEAIASPETSQLYAKYYAYCRFRGLFLFYIIVPSAVSVLAAHFVSWSDMATIILASEGSLWIIFSGVAWTFRPGLEPLRVFRLAVVVSSDSDSDESQE